jgi:hypothetical protein
MGSKAVVRKHVSTANNEYRCCLEQTQSGKQSVRIRARFARQDWELNVYFVAPTREQALRKLDRALRFLQQNEERLWFWGADRQADPDFAAGILSDIGLKLDRRTEFPERFTVVTQPSDQPMIAAHLALARRGLAQSREATRAVRD